MADRVTRRRLLELGLAVPPAALLVAADPVLAATPSCDDGDEPTVEQTEGPYFTPRSPRRRSILPAGAPGTRLTLTGRVLTTRCRPVPRALLDFWQADARGEYDNEGYRFRGNQLTDARGRYVLETVVPGLYPGRTRHIHVRVQPPAGPLLTTQLYFPRERANAGDPIFDPSLVVRGWRVDGARRRARFDFVVAL
jgi:protocatechuate 3,4-dioxygenase beta subunit